MYSGTTLTNSSGRILGAHQKIDRVARNNLSKLLVDNSLFPNSKKILYFEGKNGPDGIKRKSPAQNEPWHYFNPFDDNDKIVIDQIDRHYKFLVKELIKNNIEKSAFEAAWLAHTIVDGLTPAHHYPYEEKLKEIRGNEDKETRNSIKSKLVQPGDNKKELVKNNWKMWGPKGLMTTHGLFELGIAAIIAPLSFKDSKPSYDEVKAAYEMGLNEYFIKISREIAVLDMYNRYYKKGWTAKLSVEVRNKLVPDIIKTVTIFWYCSLIDAKIIRNI